MDKIDELLTAAGLSHQCGADHIEIETDDTRDIIVTESPDKDGEFVVAMYHEGFKLLDWDVMAEVPAEKVVDTVTLFLNTKYVGD